MIRVRLGKSAEEITRLSREDPIAFSMWFDFLTTETAALRELVKEMQEAITWMTGSPDFCPGGQARDGFEKLVHPVLERYRVVTNQEEQTGPPDQSAR